MNWISGLRRVLLATPVVLAVLGCGSAETPATGLSENGPRVRARGGLEQLRRRGAPIFSGAERNQADGTFSYLEAQFAEPGKLPVQVAIDGNGKLLSHEEAEDRFLAEHRAVWGAVSTDAASEIVRSPPGIIQVLAIAREGKEDALLSEAQALDPDAAKHPSMGGVSLKAQTGAVIHNLAFSPSVRLITLANPMHPRRAGVNGPPFQSTASLSSHADTAFNSVGNFGDGIAVGIIEALASADRTVGCRVYDEHEAFKDLHGGSIHYQIPTKAVPPCAGVCGVAGETITETDAQGHLYCVDTYVGAAHSTHVASRIAASQACGATSCPHMAAKVDLWVAQPCFLENGVSNQCDSLQWDAAMSWLYTGGASGHAPPDAPVVSIVNNSTGFDVLDSRDTTTDIYTRDYGMLVFDVAGDGGATDKVWCNGFNSLCVGSVKLPDHAPPDDPLSRLNSGAWAMSDLVFDPGDSLYTPDASNKGRTRPNLMAEGASYSSVAKAAGPTDWETAYGSSFAAPVAAGVAAMMRKACDATFPFSPLAYRAAWYLLLNSEQGQIDSNACTGPNAPPTPLYPESYYEFDPAVSCLYKAGIGPLDARKLSALCPYSQTKAGTATCGASQSDPCPDLQAADLKGGPGKGWAGVPCDAVAGCGWLNDANATRAGQGLTVLNVMAPDRRWLPKGTYKDVLKGTRVRAVLSYNSCPIRNHYQKSDTVEVNLDLALCGHRAASPTQVSCVWATGSPTETNEGFDVIVPEAYKDLTIYIVGDQTPDANGNWGCPDPGSGSSNHHEPVELGVLVWRASLLPPVIVAPEYTCANWVDVQDVIPGATVAVSKDPGLGGVLVAKGSGVINDDHGAVPVTPLQTGDFLEASQTFDGMFSGLSTPVTVTDSNSQATPSLQFPPFYACGADLLVVNAPCWSQVRVVDDDAGAQVVGTGVATPLQGCNANVSVTPLVQGHHLHAEYLQCGQLNWVAQPAPHPAVVAYQGVPPQVSVDSSIHPGTKYISLSNLADGATVDIYVGANLRTETAVPGGLASIAIDPITVAEFNANLQVKAQQRLCAAGGWSAGGLKTITACSTDGLTGPSVQGQACTGAGAISVTTDSPSCWVTVLDAQNREIAAGKAPTLYVRDGSGLATGTITLIEDCIPCQHSKTAQVAPCTG